MRISCARPMVALPYQKSIAMIITEKTDANTEVQTLLVVCIPRIKTSAKRITERPGEERTHPLRITLSSKR